jgi:hypothetical protein
MAYYPAEERFGLQPINVANAPIPAGLQVGQSQYFGKAVSLGTIIRAIDPVFGEGEFIYLQLPPTGNIGQFVTWGGFGVVPGDPTNLNEAQFQATLTTNTVTQSRALGVLMAAFPPTPANLSGAPVNAFGWAQIKGTAVILSNGTAAAGSQPYLTNSANAGTITTTATAGMEIWNTRIIAAAGTALPVLGAGNVLTNVAPFSVTAAAVAAGGSGYQVGDVLTVLGGTGSSTPAQVTVATLSGSAVATVTVAFGGYYGLTAPSGTVATSGGHGTGATFALTTAQNYCVGQIDRPSLPGIIT